MRGRPRDGRLAHAYLYAAQILTQIRRLDLANHVLHKAMEIGRTLSDEVPAAGTVRAYPV